MTTRRRTRQGGQQIVEFAFVAILFVPLFMGSVITGLNLIRSNQVNHIARDLADMYIHGADFSDRGMQRVARRLATGLDLQVGTATGNVEDNIGNGGRGIVWVSRLMKVGTQTEAMCQAALPATCTNLGKFVFQEHIRFGNGSLQSERDASVGHPTATRNSSGSITQDVVKTAGAAIPEPQQTDIRNIWQGTIPASRTPLADQTVIYMVEVYFKSPDLSLGTMSGRGVYARWFY